MRNLTSFTVRGALKGGKLMLDNERYFLGMLMGFADCKVRVVIEHLAKPRSSNQRKYYWGVVLPVIGEYIGETPERLHAIFKEKYLREKVLWRGGEIFIPRRSEELTSNEYSEFMTSVLLEAAELGVEVPPPDPDMVARKTAS